MFCFVDESGNTGLELFDRRQPALYYGLLTARSNLDITAEPLLRDLRQYLGVSRLHANELGVRRLTAVADRLIKFSKKNDLRFYFFKVVKLDHALISFFDQVFDSGMNRAVSWHHYFTPLRYVLLFKVAFLFDDALIRDAWKARRERNPVSSAKMLTKICSDLLRRVDILPDARSRELISGALKWAAANPLEISYGISSHDTALQISPNLVGFQQVMQIIALESAARKMRVRQITVDRQTEFNHAQAELSEIYRRLRGHKSDLGPGMPKFNYSLMPETPPIFKREEESAGLEMVDVSLWLAKRHEENRSISTELRALLSTQFRRGHRNEISLKGLDRRWRHLADLPIAESPLPEEMQKRLEELEDQRRAEVNRLEG